MNDFSVTETTHWSLGIGWLVLNYSCHTTIMNLSYSRYRKELSRSSRGENHGEESSSEAGGRFSRVLQWGSLLVAEGFMACAVVVFPGWTQFILLYFLFSRSCSLCRALLESKWIQTSNRDSTVDLARWLNSFHDVYSYPTPWA